MDLYKEENDEESFSTLRLLKTSDDFEDRYKNAIPIGNVRFVEQYLKIFKGIERDNAIEIPPVLRTDEFPGNGSFFIKDATQQK